MGKVNVVIVDATGNKEQKVGLPDDVKCGIIMVKPAPIAGSRRQPHQLQIHPQSDRQAASRGANSRRSRY